MSDTIEPTDDVAGHGRMRLTDPQPDGVDDVEAHAFRMKVADDSTDDVEGHGRTRLTDTRPEDPAGDAPLSDDDVTGHAMRGRV